MKKASFLFVLISLLTIDAWSYYRLSETEPIYSPEEVEEHYLCDSHFQTSMVVYLPNTPDCTFNDISHTKCENGVRDKRECKAYEPLTCKEWDYREEKYSIIVYRAFKWKTVETGLSCQL